MTRIVRYSIGLAALQLAVAAPACSQALERRVAAAPAGNVSFSFAARQGVCGDGRTYIRSDNDMWYGSFNDAVRAMPCETGPVRVVLIRDGRDLLRLQVFAGPLQKDSAATSLGTVAAQDAVTYLLSVAAGAEGRPGRDALMPAMLADSATVTPQLMAIVRNADRSREVRRSALSWLVRRRTERGAPSAAELSRTFVGIARDDNENRTVREQALSSLSRLESSAGLDALVELTRDPTDGWLAKRSVEMLSNGGDPRARQYLHDAAERTDLSEEARVAAINGVAGEFATSKDAEFLRGLYPKLSSDRLRDAVMGGVATIGGRDSRTWIVSIAKDNSAAIRQRKRAIELAERLGMAGDDLAGLYDAIADGEVRASIISQLGNLGTRAASTKLLSIAKDDPLVSNRRRAIQALGRFDDPRVKEALRGMVERG